MSFTKRFVKNTKMYYRQYMNFFEERDKEREEKRKIRNKKRKDLECCSRRSKILISKSEREFKEFMKNIENKIDKVG